MIEVKLEKVLKDRGGKYGSFVGNAQVTQNLMKILTEQGENSGALKHMHVEAIHMICHKLSRIVNGDCNYADSWVDIAGYAQLVVKELEKK